MEDRIMKLYKELDFLLNNSPIENDCSDEQNEMYSDMANLKGSIEKVFIYKINKKCNSCFKQPIF